MRAGRPSVLQIFREVGSLRFCRRLLTGVVGAYGMVSLTLGGTRQARPVFHGLVVVWLLFLGLVAWRARRRQPALGKHLPSHSGRWTAVISVTEVIAFNLALTLVLAELSLRIFAAWAGTSLVLSDTLDACRLTPGQDYGGGLRGNALGYPGPVVPFADNYLTVLAASLPDGEVYNFGVSGAGPREYQAILQRDVWTFQPD